MGSLLEFVAADVVLRALGFFEILGGVDGTDGSVAAVVVAVGSDSLLRSEWCRETMKCPCPVGHRGPNLDRCPGHPLLDLALDRGHDRGHGGRDLVHDHGLDLGGPNFSRTS